MASVDDIMSAAEMKPILAVAKREPVSVSLGLTGDKSAAIMVSKRAGPKKVRSQMRAEAKKLKIEIESGTIRFGMAMVDEEDGGLLLFRVNKAPSGALVTKVRERMRKAAWSKIEFVVDETLEEAPEEEGEGEQAGDSAPAAPPPAPPPPPPVAAPVTPPPTAQAKGNGSETGPVVYAKSRLAWLAARRKIETDLDHLKAVIIETFKDEDMAGVIDTAYRKEVAPVLDTLDESLADALDDATNATDPEVRAKHVAQARAIMGKYAQFLGSSQIVTELDTNPFSPIAIKATIGGTLGALSKAIR